MNSKTSMKKLPYHLLLALASVAGAAGDDLYFVLGHVAKNTARSYMSQLKARGLAYTHVSNGTTEVWPTKAGEKLLAERSEELPS